MERYLTFALIVPIGIWGLNTNYDWKQANCERLFDDLVSLTKSHRDGHFFGSVVTVENEDGFSTERLVIDGQQRVTTVSLLLLAMYRLLDNGEAYGRSRSALRSGQAAPRNSKRNPHLRLAGFSYRNG